MIDNVTVFPSLRLGGTTRYVCTLSPYNSSHVWKDLKTGDMFYARAHNGKLLSANDYPLGVMLKIVHVSEILPHGDDE